MQTSDGKLLVCTSPSFNSKCRHQGTACLDWDNVKLSPAQGSQPDSGVDNTEDQEQEKRAMVEKWSEDAARHTGEWTEDPNGEFLVRWKSRDQNSLATQNMEILDKSMTGICRIH